MFSETTFPDIGIIVPVNFGIKHESALLHADETKKKPAMPPAGIPSGYYFSGSRTSCTAGCCFTHCLRFSSIPHITISMLTWALYYIALSAISRLLFLRYFFCAADFDFLILRTIRPVFMWFSGVICPLFHDCCFYGTFFVPQILSSSFCGQSR